MEEPAGTVPLAFVPKTETIGDWATEQASAAAFDGSLPAGLFRIYEEVPGFLLQPRPDTGARRFGGSGTAAAPSLRIDRVLIPTKDLLATGWLYGAIGIEIKRSGVKIGPALAQAMDYTRCAWRVGGVLIHLGAVFLWPCAKQFGPTGSLMAQNRVGSVHSSNWASVYFQLGNETVLYAETNGRVVLGDAASGRKVGSR